MNLRSPLDSSQLKESQSAVLLSGMDTTRFNVACIQIDRNLLRAAVCLAGKCRFVLSTRAVKFREIGCPPLAGWALTFPACASILNGFAGAKFLIEFPLARILCPTR